MEAALANRLVCVARKCEARRPEATGVSEVRFVWKRSEENAGRQSDDNPPKRMGRRETPNPPVSWSRVQARCQGRGASLEEKPVADEARVLVFEEVGSRSRS